MKDGTLVRIVAILCATAIEIVNLYTLKLDGTLLNLVIVALLGMAGYDVLKKKEKGS